MQVHPQRVAHLFHNEPCPSYEPDSDRLPCDVNMTELSLLETLTASQPLPLLQVGRSFIYPKDWGVLISYNALSLNNQALLLQKGLFLAHAATCTLGSSQMKGSQRQSTFSLKVESSTSGCECIYNKNSYGFFLGFFFSIILLGVNKAYKLL